MLPPKGFRPHSDEPSIGMQPVDVSHIRRQFLDLPYASISQAQKLDIYHPENGEGPFPTILHVHGGAFAMGDKRDMQIIPILDAIKRGYAVASINYRLSGEAIFPAGLKDIKAAIRWLRAHQKEYHLDGQKMAIWGGSAGGNYAAMVCVTANISEFNDAKLGNQEYSCNIQAAVDWFGPTDFLKMDDQFNQSGLGRADHNQAESPESRYVGAKITDVPEIVKRANPMTYIHKDMPPILVQHGRIDALVPVQQSIIFVQKLEELVSRDRFEFDIIENAGHGDPLFTTPENMERVFKFLDRHLK